MNRSVRVLSNSGPDPPTVVKYNERLTFRKRKSELHEASAVPERALTARTSSSRHQALVATQEKASPTSLQIHGGCAVFSYPEITAVLHAFSEDSVKPSHTKYLSVTLECSNIKDPQ